jgi:uncharacterized protein involved in exopolysaccharide biosynthesis
MALSQNYITVSRRPPDVEDYIDMMRRYRSWILGPMFAGLVIATVIAFFWPDTYVSRATLRITPQATTLIASDFGEQMSQRLNLMEQEILSRPTLEGIINKPTLNLYKVQQRVKPMSDIVDEMKRDIVIRIEGSPIINGDGRNVASAFSISFRYPDKVAAQRVVEELVTRFTTSNLRVIHDHHELNASVIDDIMKADKAKVDEIDARISSFNSVNQGKLPEDFQSNQQMLNTLMLRTSQIGSQLQTDNDIKMTLQAQYKGLTTNKDLYESRAYNRVVTNQTQQSKGVDPNLLAVMGELQKMDAQIAGMKNTYGENNPVMKDAISQRTNLAQRKEELQREQEKAAAAQPAAAGPTATDVLDPVVQTQLVNVNNQMEQVMVQIRAKDQDIAALHAELTDTERKMAMYQGRIDAGPKSGQGYSILMREHAVAQDQYDRDQKMKSQTDQATAVEEHKAGENLELLEPPSTPEAPVEPKRQMYAAVGTAVGLMIGIMLAGAKEVKNTSLKNLKDVRAYTNMPVLSSIPLLENALLVRRKRRLNLLAWSSALIVGFLAMAISMYYYFSQTH